MKRISTLFFMLGLFFYASNTFAQSTTTGEITGKILNNDGTPGKYVTITLLKASDSLLVKGAVSDEAGVYQFSNIPFGKYLIEVTEVGMNLLESPTFSIDEGNKNITMPVVKLKSNTKMLQGVQVTAVKPFIQHKPGQTVVNVESSPVSAGNTVMEVLEKSPGVYVDQDGNISLNGKSGVNVMINGQPTHLSASQLSSVLKGMPANSVSQIELMTQPPAKYSAAGTAGLINIILKKNTAFGTNGSLTAGIGYGQYLKYNTGGSINYKNKNLSMYGNYNFDHRKNKFEMDITRNFFSTDSKILQTIMQQSSIMKVAGNNNTVQFGMDYNLAPNQTLGFVANGSFNQGSWDSHSPVYFMDANKNIDSISTSLNHIGYDWNNYGVNLHYNLEMDKGSSLTANLDYNRFYQSMPQSLSTTVIDAGDNPLHNPQQRKGQQPSTINIYAAKLDYVYPMKHNIKLEAGLKYSYVNSDNNSLFKVLKNGEWQNDPGNTNHFIYKENVNALYATLSKTFEKGWTANAGLRGEQTVIHTDQLTTGSFNKNDYFNLFPNVSLTKTIDPNNILSLSFTRRIDRPDYQNLNPFVYYIDEYTFREGNPYLKPQFVNSTELSYTFKRKYSAVLGYSHTSDIMTQVIRQVDSTHKDFQTMDNLSKLDNLTLTLGIPISITHWWSTYNSLQGYYNLYKGIYNGYALDKGITSFMLYTQQNFRLPKGWKAELSGMYRSKNIMGPIVIDPMGMISTGISKSLLQDKATLKLNAQDILQTMNFGGKMDFGNLNGVTKFHLNDRAVNLTFTWNFGNQKVQVNKYKKTGIQQEEQRIQKGNSGVGTGTSK